MNCRERETLSGETLSRGGARSQRCVRRCGVVDLEVRANETRLTLSNRERLGFGRVNTEPDGSKGWGYEGRFLELGPQAFIHRVWGDIVSKHGLWHVRSLGERHPVTVVPKGYRPIELPALGTGKVPHEFAVTRSPFTVVLAVGTSSFRIECTSTSDDITVEEPRELRGPTTAALGGELARAITATEFLVLWVMSREYRSDPPEASPSPLSYTRIRRALQLNSDRQAIAAVERLVKRFRIAGLLPDGLATELQRDWICRQAVAHDLLQLLSDRHGVPDIG